MKKIYLLIVLACVGVNACQSNLSNQTARSKNANQTHVVTNISKADKQIANAQKAVANNNVAQAKYYPGTGVITQLNKNTGEVELNHEEIKGKMPAGKTKFQIKYSDFVQDLKVGDKVNFVVEDDSGTISLSTIFKEKAGKY